MTFRYTVSCTFTDAAVRDEWIRWLADEHLADVMNGGATGGEVVRLDGDPLRCEVRYRFPDRDAFAAYERDHAPRLRDEGLSKFPLERGLEYARSTGEVVATESR